MLREKLRQKFSSHFFTLRQDGVSVNEARVEAKRRALVEATAECTTFEELRDAVVEILNKHQW